jgi:hypothetical protein
MLLLSQPSSENTKTKKIISREKNNLPRFFPIFVVSEKLEKRLKETLSKKLPKLRAIRKRVALNEKKILQVRNK